MAHGSAGSITALCVEALGWRRMAIPMPICVVPIGSAILHIDERAAGPSVKDALQSIWTATFQLHLAGGGYTAPAPTRSQKAATAAPIEAEQSGSEDRERPSEASTAAGNEIVGTNEQIDRGATLS